MELLASHTPEASLNSMSSFKSQQKNLPILPTYFPRVADRHQPTSHWLYLSHICISKPVTGMISIHPVSSELCGWISLGGMLHSAEVVLAIG